MQTVQMNKLKKSILALLFPRRCTVCGKITGNDCVLCCPSCFEKLPLDKLQRAAPVNFCRGFYSPLLYEGEARKAILRYKFRGKKANAEFLAKLMAQCFCEHCTVSVDAVTWIPVSKQRLKTRGYDQSELLARHVATILGLPLMSTLVKTKDNPAQSGIRTRAAKAENVKGVYSPSDSANANGLTFLLVDDILTTGSTMAEAARTLMKSGAEDIIGLCAARTS